MGPGSGCVLVVDDEELVLAVTGKVLKSLGFDVCLVASGELALEVLEDRASTINAVVSDVNMPGMSGVELAHEIAQKWQHLSVLLVSGKEPKVRVLRGLPSRYMFLQKPYGIQVLDSTLRALTGA